MKKFTPLFFVLLSFFISQIAIAEEATIESNSCRLTSLYKKGSQVYGGGYSKGMTFNGKYATTSNATECELRCKSKLVNRIETLNKGFTLQVECFYGKQKLFEKTFKGK